MLKIKIETIRYGKDDYCRLQDIIAVLTFFEAEERREENKDRADGIWRVHQELDAVFSKSKKAE